MARHWESASDEGIVTVKLTSLPSDGSRLRHTSADEWSLVSGLAPLVWALFGLGGVALLGFLYQDSLVYLAHEIEREDYSHGMFVPVVSVMLIWWRRQEILAVGLRSSWWGIVLVASGGGLLLVGELATLYVMQHVSLWLVVVGLVWAVTGWKALRCMAFPLCYLLVMIPPPQTLQRSLSSSLQLISSQLGVWYLQVMGIDAFREGNVIDLGTLQLQVVEACSGLRYLFPLIALAALCAYLFQDRLWRRIVLVVSAIPLAVILNGVRIGLIGLLVEHYGKGAAEGFMHLFEGWLLFLLSVALLGIELWGLEKIGAPSSGQVASAAAGQNAVVSPMLVVPSLTYGPIVGCLILLVVIAVGSRDITEREEASPMRQSFLGFPMDIAGRHGEPIPMEKKYIEALRFDDYLLADYRGVDGPVNVYVSYYESQRSGQATHSPKTCLPGGGWEIVSLEEVMVRGRSSTERGFTVNRVLIQQGTQKQVVLYWFKQRNRLVTSEYLVKFFLLWDSLTKQRSDGALIRLITPVQPEEGERVADQRVMQMAAAIHPLLPEYVPD